MHFLPIRITSKFVFIKSRMRTFLYSRANFFQKKVLLDHQLPPKKEIFNGSKIGNQKLKKLSNIYVGIIYIVIVGETMIF